MAQLVLESDLRPPEREAWAQDIARRLADPEVAVRCAAATALTGHALGHRAAISRLQ